MHPSYLGFQLDWPLFVKVPFVADGKQLKRGEHFNWVAMHNVEEEKVSILYSSGFLHHNRELEVQNKVGDRLSEMNNGQLETLVNLLNTEVKSRTSSASEFERKKCKKSRIDDKQRGLVRRFLNGNYWITEDFYRIRDKILGD
tara:strand:+ start:176 stop:604 length:429 start_codon:yes stop_codon:yes gene_type:complete